MTETVHHNLSLLMKLDIKNLDAYSDVSTKNLNFVWHYFNPKLPELEGDYCGLEGLKGFFAKLGERSNHSFQVNVIESHAVDGELL